MSTEQESKVGAPGGWDPDKASSLLRSLPSTDRVLAHPTLAGLLGRLPGYLLTAAVRQELERVREAIKAGLTEAPSLDAIASAAALVAGLIASPSLRPVINATGVVIHTNLGRAPLSRAAVEAIKAVAGYSNLEYNLAAGERGSRYAHAVQALRHVTGCEDALVVNNNAAALVLALSALGEGREVVVSRGQLVEIGGGFRIPDIMRRSGARLVEVGTTNRTYMEDYERAITESTGALMRIHTSNFRLVGFTTSPTIEELASLAHRHNLLFIDDVGSGALLDTTRYGLSPEPTVQESLKAGADLALFSGDKLLGGPQCGIIAGKSEAVARLKKHPLARALRVDKLTLAALEATLLHYLKEEAESEIPVWRMISATPQQLHTRAEAWAKALRQRGIRCEILKGESTVGGGSLPGDTLPTWLLAITPEGEEAGQLAARLREADTPVVARVEGGAALLDPRTVAESEENELLTEVAKACRQ